MTEWRVEICSSEPSELQTIGRNLYIQRRNIEAVEVEGDDDSAYTQYECESREITASEYAMLSSIEEIDTDAAIDAYTEELIEEGLI